MIYLNGENVYENSKKCSKCPHCPAEDSEEEKKSRKPKHDLTIPSSMLNNGILSFGSIFSARGTAKEKKPEKELEKLLNRRISETEKLLPPFPFSGCTLNLSKKPKVRNVEKLKKTVSEMKETDFKKTDSEKLKKTVSDHSKKPVPDNLKKTASEYLRKTSDKKAESAKVEKRVIERFDREEKFEREIKKVEEKKVQKSIEIPKKKLEPKMSKNTVKLQTCANVASQTSYENADQTPKSERSTPLIVDNSQVMAVVKKASSEDAKVIFYREESEKEFSEKTEQMIVMDSASDVHEDRVIVEQEKRAILEEMVPRINYFDFDSDVDDSPCGKYLNRLPQDFKIKTNGDLEKFEIENIVRQYRFAYYLRIMNRHPKPDFRLKRKKRPDGLERLYFEPMRRKKRLQDAQKRLSKAKRNLGPATVWNGTVSRRKAEAPKMCQSVDPDWRKMKNKLGVATIYNGKTTMSKTEAKFCGAIDRVDDEERIYRRLKSKIFEKYKKSNSFFVEDLSGVWEGDVIDVLKNFGNGDSIKMKKTLEKVRLPNLDETMGKTCPFSPWPCPLGRVCPFPGKCESEENLEKCESDRTMSNPEPFLTCPEQVETTPYKNFSFFKKLLPKAKVSVGTVTSTECVILPKNQSPKEYKPVQKVKKNYKKEEQKIKETKTFTAPEKRYVRPKEHRQKHNMKISRPKTDLGTGTRKLDDWKRLLSPVRKPNKIVENKTEISKNDLDRLLKIKEVWKRRF